MTIQEKKKITENSQIPMVGFGTYLIDDESAAEVVLQAIETGYRHIDTAEGYGNEKGVGQALNASLAKGDLKRDDLFVTTKLWPGNPDWGQQAKTTETTIESLGESLNRLQLDYVDLYLIHAPYQADQRLQQWKGMVKLQEQGKAKAIGVSNFNANHIEELKAAGLSLPAVNQIELHPWSQKPELTTYLADNGITAIAYSSLVPLSTWRTVAGQDSGKTKEMQAESEREGAPFKTMAQKYGVSEAQVLLRWGIQMGYPVLPKSTNPTRMAQNLDLFSFEIDQDDMAQIALMDRGDGVAWAIGDPTKAA